MFKKIIITLILVITILTAFSINYIYADDEDDNISEEEIQQTLIETASITSSEPRINAKSAIVFDRKSKKVLYSKNENEKRAMASTTKIMTAIIVLENSNLSDIVTVSKKAANTGGSVLKIKENDKISVNDLLYGLMLRSGNDAAVALAEYIGGSVESFAYLMNKKAEELGLKNTNFVTPHGLDNNNHYTTAYELAILTDYALSNERFAQIVATKNCNISINGEIRNINNTNELLGNLYGVDGVKTGFTGNAMRCLVTSCTRDNNQIITVVLGADTKKQRTIDSKNLIEYAFKNYKWVNIEELIKDEFENWKNVNEKRIVINKAKTKDKEIYLSYTDSKIMPIKIEGLDSINVEFNVIYTYEAPLKYDQKIGNIIIKDKDKTIAIVDIKIKNDIDKMNVIDYMKEFLTRIQINS